MNQRRFVLWMVVPLVIALGAGCATSNKSITANDAPISVPASSILSQPTPSLQQYLEKGGDPNATNGSGMTLLMQAAFERNLDDAKLLVAHGADVNLGMQLEHGWWTPLSTALHRRPSRRDLKLGALGGLQDVSISFNDSSLDMAKFLVAKGADVNAQKSGTSPLLLQTINTSFSKNDNTLDRVKLLIEGGANVNATNTSGETPFTAAASGRNLAVLQILIDHGTNVHAKDKWGYTALTRALTSLSPNPDRYRLIDVVNFLLDKGADVNDATKDGFTPLMHAITRTNFEISKLLVDKGADFNARNAVGSTALMLAAGWGESEMVKVLLEKGADVNTANKEGLTPLMFALQWSRGRTLEDVQFLLDKGANVNAKNAAGFTPVMIATTNGQSDAVALFKKYGAKE